MNMNFWLSSTDPARFEVDQANEFFLDGYQEDDLETAIRLEPGDRIIYYIQSWEAFGAICVARSRVFIAWRPIWPGQVRPVRFERRPELVLPRERMLEASQVAPHLSFLRQKGRGPGRWDALLQESLREIPKKDFELLEGEMKKRAGGPS